MKIRFERDLSMAVGAVRRAFLRVALRLLAAVPTRYAVMAREVLSRTARIDHDRLDLSLRVTSNEVVQLRLRSATKEPATVAWIETTFEAGDVLYDIGANVGAYSLIAAALVNGEATVYAFEPGYRTFADLVDNVIDNRLASSIVGLPLALGASTSVARFVLGTPATGAAGHPGISAASTTAGIAYEVPAMRLDDAIATFDLLPPTHVKIDVDGSEMAVLQGAARALTSDRLRWLQLEVNEPTTDPKLVLQILGAAGLVLEYPTEVPGDRSTYNLLFRRHNVRPLPGAFDTRRQELTRRRAPGLPNAGL